MNLDDINKWLSLVAHLGVLVGVIFLTVELSQSNRIATTASENDISSLSIEIAVHQNESPELIVKLLESDSELTPLDYVQASSLAIMYNTLWANVENAFNSGLLSERTFRVRLRQINQTFENFPGLVPIFAELIEGFGPESA